MPLLKMSTCLQLSVILESPVPIITSGSCPNLLHYLVEVNNEDSLMSGPFKIVKNAINLSVISVS